jgi:hypothetical protein
LSFFNYPRIAISKANEIKEVQIKE